MLGTRNVHISFHELQASRERGFERNLEYKRGFIMIGQSASCRYGSGKNSVKTEIYKT